ncbi:hypothetical protein H2200_002389 [Cladophialophora chaetospira]|uniref:Glutaredoxin domain-containing protein n=1 Tax=Cladophialophora chaetospira TaxID=386627 RepID=A0AA38XJL3_9EURO|nr:hypothetical protein H2200_002389 [Cladophialophora chaetospira]
MAATSYSTDPTLFLYTSLTAGSSHIITATSRLETILKANKIPFRALDCATDEKARMLWGRRSKGRKLPGLVKYGEIIGDLEQIEEWNEYGELKEQIAATQDFGTYTAPTSNLAPEAAAASTASTPQRSGPPSRASSETRHISIAEPTEKNDGENKSGSSQKPTESPMNMAIRQLGAEAAAKAAQKKAGGASQTTKVAPAPVTEKPTDPLSSEAAVSSPDTAAEVTAAKTPTQLASEGAGRASLGKIAESEDRRASDSAEESQPTSNEEQQLEMRRQSSITNTKSRLSEVTPIAESNTVAGEEQPEVVKSPSPVAVPESEATNAEPAERPRQHRGSDIGEASLEEIRALEQKLSIPEENEESDEEASAPTITKADTVSTTDEAEKKATKSTDPQDADPKDADQAGVSVGD